MGIVDIFKGKNKKDNTKVADSKSAKKVDAKPKAGKKSNSKPKVNKTSVEKIERKPRLETEIRSADLTVTAVERRGDSFVIATKGLITLDPADSKLNKYLNLAVGARLDMEDL